LIISDVRSRLMITRIAIVLLLVSCSTVAATARTRKVPFALNVVAKPSALVAGQKHTLTVELKNRSNAPLTLSSLYAFSSSIYWSNPDGSGQGAFSGGGAKTIIGTNLDPATGEMTCKYLHYEKSDFVTIAAHSSMTFDVVVDVPEACDAPVANVTIYFEPKYDGGEVGLAAWTGEAKPINLKFRVNRITG